MNTKQIITMETYSATCMSKGGDHLSLTAHQFPPPLSPKEKEKEKKLDSDMASGGTTYKQN